MKEFFKKIWAWVLKNKVVSIVIASVVTVGLACAIILPIALHHDHKYGTELSSNATQHWLECDCGEKKDVENHEAKATYSHNDTHHWKDCIDCGYDLTIAQHTYDQEVAEETYFKEETATDVIYYKSCVCGVASSEVTFSVTKTAGTLTNLFIANKTYDGIAISEPTYNTNSNGAVTIEYKLSSADDSTYTTTAPTNAGNYIVRVSVAGNRVYSAVSQTRNFTISRKQLTIPSLLEKTYDNNDNLILNFDANETGTGESVKVEIKMQEATGTNPVRNAGSYDETSVSLLPRFYVNEIQTDNYIFVDNAEYDIHINKRALPVPSTLSKEYGSSGQFVFNYNANESGTNMNVQCTAIFMTQATGGEEIVDARTYSNTDGVFVVVSFKEQGVECQNYTLDNTGNFTVTITPKTISNKTVEINVPTGEIVIDKSAFGISSSQDVSFRLHLEETLNDEDEINLVGTETSAGPGVAWLEVTGEDADNYAFDWTTIKAKYNGVYASFAEALEIDCSDEASETLTLNAGQVIYIKLAGVTDSTADVSLYAPSGSSGLTFTYKIYAVNDTTTPTQTNDTAATDIYYQATGGEAYVVITCVTAGQLNIATEN